ncbi:cyclase family protein [Bacillus sp. H-16]|uniref:cyclase family protein n=1 Tax=Alteribacter salitolerans TaxID=2912333 RepID=UPI0019654BDC|nr:cyclase family protein [Alteribacter salitolerans]MBM7094595.1 cyclase family protein [Alteribacter salitolerans]
MKFIDITQTLRENMNVWPGDTAFSYEPMLETKKGDSVNVGRITMSSHTGTHIDAPFHVNGEEKTMDELSLDLFTGEAMVIELDNIKTIDSSYIESIPLNGVKKVLFKTTSRPGGHSYEDYPEVAPALADFLKQAGVHMIGVDFPSVDPLTSKELKAHHALNKAGIIILEGLDLSQADQGRYELFCFPLKLKHGDGSPVRAVLKQLR